ncbi:unnamed protein product [Echinostoma caproni]|uniref:ELL domain-containing protein n=1 Tax=Echinostoma caproni TaxID=27848 RepID=A0A183BCW5_9TREM|nr:unnamed protein product [Echinostoma caproni]
MQVSFLDANVDPLSRGRIRCLGKVNCRFTVNAKEDSFSMAREKMAQLGDESRRSQTKEINSYKKHPRRFGTYATDFKKRVDPQGVSGQSDTRSSSFIDSTNSRAVDFPVNRYSGSSSTLGPSSLAASPAVCSRSLRERVIHLLALRPYQRPELLLRLKRDGLTQTQKNQLDDVLSDVGQQGRRLAYHLTPNVFCELDPYWPGYSAGERKRILALKVNVIPTCFRAHFAISCF